MDESQKKAFDFSADMTKLLITLASAVFAFTVTFAKDAPGSERTFQKIFVLISWVFYILSIGCGILTLMALTGNLDPMAIKKQDPNDKSKTITTTQQPILTITSPNVITTSQFQFIFFALAIICTGLYGYNLLYAKKPDTDKDNKIVIVHDGKVVRDTIWLPAERSGK